MKKGFTLIELLAVIVILAIISLIAVPIVLNIINNSRTNSYIRSAELYSDNIQNKVASKIATNTEFNPTSCTANNDGTATCQGITLDIVRSKTSPKSGNIILSNGQIQNGSTLVFDTTTLKYENHKWVIQNNSDQSIALEDCFDTAYYDNNKNSVSVSGYSCGNTTLSVDENGVYTYGNDGIYTDVTIPEELPLTIVSSATFNYDKCITNIMNTVDGSIEDAKEVCDSYKSNFSNATKEEVLNMVNNSLSLAEMIGFDIVKTKTTKKYKVVAISNNAFNSQIAGSKTNFNKLVIPDSVEYIGMSILTNNQVKQLTVSKNLKEVDERGISDINLDKLIIPGKYNTIGAMFYDTTINELVFTDNTKTIDFNIFSNSATIKKIVIPSSVEEILNSLKNKTVEEVIVNGKSKLSDFVAFNSESPFGWVEGKSNEDIKWQN